jgi:hypothetical protein
METSDAESLATVCHRGGLGRADADGVDAVGNVKWEVPRLNALPPHLASACRLKASNSGLASSGTGLGRAAANDLTDDVGGLQLSFGSAAESLSSAELSTGNPK